MKVFINIWNWIIFEVNTIWNYIHYRYMKKKADRLHKLTGRRYFVVPKTANSLTVVDNSYIKYYNKVNKNKQITIVDLINMSYYATSVQGIIRK
jgi:hypothetical protein